MTILSIALFSLGMVSSVAFIVYISYVGLMWFLDKPFTYRALLQWVGFVIIMALISGGVSYFIPESWHVIMAIVLSNFGCMLAFHVFFLKVEEFLSLYCHYGIKSWVLYGVIGIMYALFSVNAVVLATINSSGLIRMSQMGIEYLTRTAILFSLLLEIKLRRHAKDIQQNDHPKIEAQEYQNYDNQW